MLRFAPSPTGDMHIETLRVAILNYLVSQQHNERFIVRIEDNDKERTIEGKDTEFMEVLEKFALTHDSVSHQSENLHMHQTLAIKLLEEGKAFICTCSDETIERDQENASKNNLPYRYSGVCSDINKKELSKLKENGVPFVIRIKKPEDEIMIEDIIMEEIHSSPDEVDSFVILRPDGTPAYDFARACEDMLLGVNFIIDTKSSLNGTARQKHIQTLLGYEQEIRYAHLPDILNADSEKIEKEDETSLLKWLLEEGFIPDAIINYLLLLGYPKPPKEIFTLPEAIEWFKLENISQSDVKFDIDKLRLINREHLKRMDDTQLSSLFGFADAQIGKLAKLFLKEVSTTKELQEKIGAVFSPKNFEGPDSETMRIIEKIIWDAPMIDNFDTFKSHIIDQSGLDEKEIMQPLRILLTGAKEGPELADIYPYIKSYILEVAS